MAVVPECDEDEHGMKILNDSRIYFYDFSMTLGVRRDSLVNAALHYDVVHTNDNDEGSFTNKCGYKDMRDLIFLMSKYFDTPVLLGGHEPKGDHKDIFKEVEKIIKMCAHLMDMDYKLPTNIDFSKRKGDQGSMLFYREEWKSCTWGGDNIRGVMKAFGELSGSENRFYCPREIMASALDRFDDIGNIKESGLLTKKINETNILFYMVSYECPEQRGMPKVVDSTKERVILDVKYVRLGQGEGSDLVTRTRKHRWSIKSEGNKVSVYIDSELVGEREFRTNNASNSHSESNVCVAVFRFDTVNIGKVNDGSRTPKGNI